MNRREKRESMKQLKRLHECVSYYLNWENPEDKEEVYSIMRKRWHKYVENWNKKHPNNPSDYAAFDRTVKNLTQKT